MEAKKDPDDKRGNFLTPNKKAVVVEGKLFYSEGDGSWNTIRLKKEILHEFPQLKEKSSSFGYRMVVFKSSEQAKEALSKSEKHAVPILLFLSKT